MLKADRTGWKRPDGLQPAGMRHLDEEFNPTPAHRSNPAIVELRTATASNHAHPRGVGDRHGQP